jgi:hypothetical protein
MINSGKRFLCAFFLLAENWTDAPLLYSESRDGQEISWNSFPPSLHISFLLPHEAEVDRHGLLWGVDLVPAYTILHVY